MGFGTSGDISIVVGPNLMILGSLEFSLRPNSTRSGAGLMNTVLAKFLLGQP